MHAARGRGMAIQRGPSESRRGWLRATAEREASKEKQRRYVQRERERETEAGRQAGKRTERARDRAGADARERERTAMKKGKRGGTRYREGVRECARVKAGGRERRQAAPCPAEGTRWSHMCSETNVRSECRLLPIIRCRGVPLCARGWSADSVPRFYAARQPGPVRARGYPRKPRAKCVANRARRPYRRVLEL